ncbi:alkaline phosphatase family protein [Halosimplex amylolyticum]|uniref:alkaline phosphatase family protein n=1 Tax=Halosimplex amylolyticum TaxID=3396616 RepID=UPI003F5449F8
MSEQRTVVFGLDGAHFELLEPWIEAGDLPNVAQAMGDGVTGDLEVVLPPVTSPNWKAYMTGKNPGKLGIFWWENIDVESQRIYYPDDRKNLQTDYWEIIAEDTTVGVVNTPTTYPPKSIDGHVVSGPPDGQGSGYTHPTSLEQRLNEKFSYRVNSENRLQDNVDRAAEEMLELIDNRFEAARWLFEEHDLEFLQATTFYINSLHHFLWDDEYTKTAWQTVDDHLGYFLNRDDTNVVLMSDHGSTEIETVFHINTWLQDHDYLEVNTAVARSLGRLGVHRDTVASLASRLGVRRALARFAPQQIIDYIPTNQGAIKRESKTNHIDWAETAALASGQGPVYLTKDRSDPDYERVRAELMEQLASVTDDASKPVARRVLRGEDVYHGEYIDDAPDIVVEQREGVHITGSIGRENVFTTPADEPWDAENKRDGLFVACGPSFTEGTIENISILDLAPTLLHLHGCAVPADMDGEVLEDVFDKNAEPRRREPNYATRDKKAAEKERIKRIARESVL